MTGHDDTKERRRAGTAGAVRAEGAADQPAPTGGTPGAEPSADEAPISDPGAETSRQALGEVTGADPLQDDERAAGPDEELPSPGTDDLSPDATDDQAADATDDQAARPSGEAHPDDRRVVTLSMFIADEPLDGEAGGGEPPGPPVSDELKGIVEALIFASPDPLTPKALFKVLDSEPREDVERAIAALKRDYERRGGLQLVEIAGGFQIVTRSDLSEWVRRLFQERKTTRLSVQALETLAVIAYKQPVTAPEIAEIRGVNTSGVLATLIERKLVKIAGRKAVVGRPFLYATTREFLIRFGLNDLGDLPKVEDLADALGFDLPSALDTGPSEPMLPLGDPDATVAPPRQADPAADAATEDALAAAASRRSDPSSAAPDGVEPRSEPRAGGPPSDDETVH